METAASLGLPAESVKKLDQIVQVCQLPVSATLCISPGLTPERRTSMPRLLFSCSTRA